MKKYLVLALTVFFVGCATSTDPVIKVSTATLVVVGNAANSHRGDVNQLAQSECQAYGKEAVRMPNSVDDYNASFACR